MRDHRASLSQPGHRPGPLVAMTLVLRALILNSQEHHVSNMNLHVHCRPDYGPSVVDGSMNKYLIQLV